jgi:signal peptidase II
MTTTTPTSAAASAWRWYALAIGVLIADQASKQAILNALTPGQWIPVSGWFNLVLAFNRGAAFSFLDQSTTWQQYLFLAIALGVSAFIVRWLRRPDNPLLLNLALACIMGGALGNALDRVRLQHVVDFLDVHWAFLNGLFPGGHFPAFNLADSAITLGVILLILDELRRSRGGNQPGQSHATE